MNSFLILEKEPDSLQMWHTLLEERHLHYLATSEVTHALDFCRRHVNVVVLAEGELLSDGEASWRLVEELRAASPLAMLIALWTGSAGNKVAFTACLKADFNVWGSGDCAYLIRLLDIVGAWSRQSPRRAAHISSTDGEYRPTLPDYGELAGYTATETPASHSDGLAGWSRPQRVR